MTRPVQRISGLVLGAALVGLLGTLPLAPAASAGGGVPKPTARDKCPVCGMFVAKYPDWLATVCLRNGAHIYFDGAKDMFKYLHDPKRYDPARGPADIRDIVVMDYYGLNGIDGRKAWYVLGSDVYGPMGRELIPLAREAEAREFMKDHKGTRIVRFAEATPEVIRSLE